MQMWAVPAGAAEIRGENEPLAGLQATRPCGLPPSWGVATKSGADNFANKLNMLPQSQQ
eukprot:CAMPEP_0172746000 /NCGR_PEP_ID=MMETSP1074-20121228/139359_1 /TAXON_ID=2916 /ORGANISM="Ceratium fusus, Strain PA161109" /LENGTH=58 /DNA_ID=CAMNT_0013577275 /DNA_START=73 /DNA_END=246 /DNA_ORIENTATION=-